MQVIKATEARQNFFSILDEVFYGGKDVVIEKGSKVKVKISSIKPPKKFDFVKYRKDLKKMGKIFTDEDVKDIEEARKSMDRDLGGW